MEDRVKELEAMIKTLQKEKNKKPKFNKWIVTLMVLMVICYTVAHLYIFLTIGSEPETLAKLFFSFVTIELALVAEIGRAHV